MVKFLALFVAWLILGPSFAEARFQKMADQHYRILLSEDVNTFGYKGCPRELVMANPFILESEKAEYIRIMEAASVRSDKYLEVIRGVGLPESAKAFLRELVAGRDCLFLAHLEEWGVPAQIIELFELKKTYEVDKIHDREICLGMSFTVDGVHKMRNIIFAGKELPALVFKTAKSRLKVVLKCSNGCVPTMDLVLPYIEPGAPTVTQALRKERSQSSVTDECPDGYKIVANVWSLRDMPLEMQREVNHLISLAARRNTRKATDPTGYRGDAVSRTMGALLRNKVQTLAPVSANNANIKVFYRQRRTLELAYTLEEVLSVTSGTGNIDLFADPRKWVVELVWPQRFISPVESGGERRLWIFPDEWKDWCWLNVHGVVP